MSELRRHRRRAVARRTVPCRRRVDTAMARHALCVDAYVTTRCARSPRTPSTGTPATPSSLRSQPATSAFVVDAGRVLPSPPRTVVVVATTCARESKLAEWTTAPCPCPSSSIGGLLGRRDRDRRDSEPGPVARERGGYGRKMTRTRSERGTTRGRVAHGAVGGSSAWSLRDRRRRAQRRAHRYVAAALRAWALPWIAAAASTTESSTLGPRAPARKSLSRARRRAPSRMIGFSRRRSWSKSKKVLRFWKKKTLDRFVIVARRSRQSQFFCRRLRGRRTTGGPRPRAPSNLSVRSTAAWAASCARPRAPALGANSLVENSSMRWIIQRSCARCGTRPSRSWRFPHSPSPANSSLRSSACGWRRRPGGERAHHPNCATGRLLNAC